MNPSGLRSFVVAAIATIGVAATARAQGGGVSMDIDASVISSGMGGASTAVFWTAEPNAWANPALLGYTRGMLWESSSTDLLPGLFSGVTFETRRLSVAGSGLGFQLAGKPGGLGSTELVFDPDPFFVTGSSESVDALRFGISLGQVAEAIALLRGQEPPGIVKRFDLAVGYASKHATVELTPGNPIGHAEADCKDFGVMARVGGVVHAPGFGPEARLDFAIAQAVLNYDEGGFSFPNDDVIEPATQLNHTGVALHLVSAPRATESGSGFGAFIRRGLDPWVSLGIAYDHVSSRQNGELSQNLAGLELSLMNVLSLRGGYMNDDLGEIHDASYGLGLNLPLGGVAGLRYDFAAVGSPEGVDPIHRHSVIAFLDPLAAIRAIR